MHRIHKVIEDKVRAKMENALHDCEKELSVTLENFGAVKRELSERHHEIEVLKDTVTSLNEDNANLGDNLASMKIKNEQVLNKQFALKYSVDLVIIIYNLTSGDGRNFFAEGSSEGE